MFAKTRTIQLNFNLMVIIIPVINLTSNTLTHKKRASQNVTISALPCCISYVDKPQFGHYHNYCLPHKVTTDTCTTGNNAIIFNGRESPMQARKAARYAIILLLVHNSTNYFKTIEHNFCIVL